MGDAGTGRLQRATGGRWPVGYNDRKTGNGMMSDGDGNVDG